MGGNMVKWPPCPVNSCSYVHICIPTVSITSPCRLNGGKNKLLLCYNRTFKKIKLNKYTIF